MDMADGTLRWERQAADSSIGESFTMPPLVYDDLVIIGPAGSELGVPGGVGGFRLADGSPGAYAYFGNVGLYCLDMDGQVLWSREVEPSQTRLGWGTAASPVLHDGRLYVVNDNNEQSYLMALSAETGAELWRVDRDEGTNWSTPYVWENDQRTELVTTGTDRVRSYDLHGIPLWELTRMSSITIPTPFSEFGLLYISSGYIGDQNRPVFAIRPGASGDISLGLQRQDLRVVRGW